MARILDWLFGRNRIEDAGRPVNAPTEDDEGFVHAPDATPDEVPVPERRREDDSPYGVPGTGLGGF